MPYNQDMVQVRAPRHGQRYQAPSMRLGRSQFDISRMHKTTFDAGRLIPYLVEEVIPGDTMTCQLQAFLRIFSPLDAPVMDNIEVSIDYFFVPNRLIWDNWEAFLGAHDAAGAQDTDFTIPKIATGTTIGTTMLYGYMGVPIGLSTTSEDVNALPGRAYALIYNEWYRDQNVIDEITVPTGDGPDSGTLVASAAVRTSAKKHDYFTSALPYLQKGDVQYSALTGDAPIYGIGVDTADGFSSGTSPTVEETDGTQETWSFFRKTDDAGVIYVEGQDGSTPNIYADLDQVSAGVSINALREAAAIQRLLERDARGGTRMVEQIKAHFGVTVPDFRAQRPEYLGGGKGYINISPVANTSPVDSANSPTGSDLNQAQLTGTGAGSLRASWAKSFVEHGYVLGILRARGEVSYQQGLHRMWSRSTKYDFLWPELSQLGEQEILNKELWIEGDSTDDNVFGYQERYAEYRYGKNLVTGKFSSDASGSLDFWHLAEDFGAQPSLNQTFIEDATPMARVTTVDSEPDFIVDGRHDLKVARALPVRPTPTLAPARF